MLILGLAAAPALAIEGLAPAGPCAEAESPTTGPVVLLFSPQDVASAGPTPSLRANPPQVQGFQGRGPCDSNGGCGGLNNTPNAPTNPPVNPPSSGTPPV